MILQSIFWVGPPSRTKTKKYQRLHRWYRKDNLMISILNNNYIMRVISVFILPLSIYGLNVFGGVGMLLFLTGILVLFKSFLDLKTIQHSLQRKHKQTHASRPCYLCKKDANLIPYHAQGKRMAICSQCYSCIQFSDHCA